MSEFQPEYQKRLAKAIVHKKPMIPIGFGLFKVIKNAFRQLFRPHIVVQYPNEKYELPPRARYCVRMKYDEQGNHKCRACLICQNACPYYVINIDVETGEDRSKFIKRFAYQQGACMVCGLCVESCPFDAIRMSHDYELAHSDPALLSIDLLENVPAAVAPPRKEPAEKVAPEPKVEEAPAVAEAQPREPAEVAASTLDERIAAIETPSHDNNADDVRGPGQYVAGENQSEEVWVPLEEGSPDSADISQGRLGGGIDA